MTWSRQKQCQQCGGCYSARRIDQKFCSPACRLRHYRRQKRLEKARYQLTSLSSERAAQLQALEDYAPGTRELIAGIVADHDIDAGRQALRLAHHVAGVVAEEV